MSRTTSKYYGFAEKAEGETGFERSSEDLLVKT